MIASSVGVLVRTASLYLKSAGFLRNDTMVIIAYPQRLLFRRNLNLLNISSTLHFVPLIMTSFTYLLAPDSQSQPFPPFTPLPVQTILSCFLPDQGYVQTSHIHR